MPNVKNINVRIKNIKTHGMKPVTELLTVQQEYAGFIYNNATEQSGQIRSLKQVNEFRHKIFKDNYISMSENEYESRLNELLEQYGDKLTVIGARRASIKRAQNIFDDFSAKTGKEVPLLNTRNYKQYLDKLAEAGRISAQLKGRGAAYNFYEILEELMSTD